MFVPRRVVIETLSIETPQTGLLNTLNDWWRAQLSPNKLLDLDRKTSEFSGNKICMARFGPCWNVVPIVISSEMIPWNNTFETQMKNEWYQSNMKGLDLWLAPFGRFVLARLRNLHRTGSQERSESSLYTPHPVNVTTRIITFLVGYPYKPSLATGGSSNICSAATPILISLSRQVSAVKTKRSSR